MTESTLARLDADFAMHPMLAAGPASETDVAALEAAIGFALPRDYTTFVRRYGGAIVGPYSVFGVGAANAMGSDESSALQVTKRFRAQRWPETESALVVSMDHSGNAITLDTAGRVNRFDHDSRATDQLGTSFEDFIVNWCLKGSPH